MNDQNDIQSQLISTRIYCFLLAISLFLLALYTSQIKITISETIPKPTYDQYMRLYSLYHQTLICPCESQSITYNDVIYVNIFYHDICQSAFVEETWIDALLVALMMYQKSLDNTPINPIAARYSFLAISGPLFQAIRSFCQVTSTIVQESLEDFYQTQFISVTTLSSAMFYSKINEALLLTISNTVRSFIQARQNIRDTTTSNALMSGLITNFYFRVESKINVSNETFNLVATYDWITINETKICSCTARPSCIIPATISLNITESVPGIYAGCYLIEALLQSNLLCFYNQSCINRLVHLLNLTNIGNVSALGTIVSSRYQMNSTFEEIIDQLMVEQWSNITSHRSYYKQCHPSACSYSYQAKNRLITVLTTLIEVLGGLTVILHFVVPKFVRWIRSPRRDNTSK